MREPVLVLINAVILDCYIFLLFTSEKSYVEMVAIASTYLFNSICTHIHTLELHLLTNRHTRFLTLLPQYATEIMCTCNSTYPSS